VRIDGFDWDEENAVKNVLHHDAYPDEIEEVFYNPHRLRKVGRGRYLLYGITDSGRYLFAVFMIRKSGNRNLARVISARTMTKKEKAYYSRK